MSNLLYIIAFPFICTVRILIDNALDILLDHTAKDEIFISVSYIQ